MALLSFLDRERSVAHPGYSRWLVPPAALAIHLAIGQVYAFSVFKIPLTQQIGITKSAPGDWTQPELAWIFSLAIVMLGLSAAVFGRLLAGYCGFFWRGPRAFAGGRVLAGGGLEGPEVMGQRAPWLAYGGEFDGIDGHATLVFRAAPDTPGGDPVWFVRSTPFAAVNPSLAFFEGLDQAPGETLARSYRVTIADGAWDRERIEAQIAGQTW